MSSLRYLSVCSGMEAASVAWEPLGFMPVGFSEIEPFPCAILSTRFPQIPNHGSLTEYKSWPIEPGAIDLLVGGTPCQSFSVAGLRKGLEDPRGNLALVFLGLADKLKPRWIVWENVPGVLSSNGGRDLGSFLGALVQLGYGFAYRVLDAQHFGVPQRRRRIILVACLGDWRAPAEVLLEPDCVRRDIKKGRAKGEGVASGAEGGVGADHPEGCWRDGGQVSQTLDAVLQKGQTMPEKNRFPAVLQPVCATGQIAHCLTKSYHGSEDGTGRGTPIVCATGSTTHALTASSSKGATEDGTGRGTPIVIDRAAFNQGVNAQYEPHIEETEVMDSLVARGPHAVGQPIPIQDGREMEKNQNGMGIAKEGDPAYTIDTTGAQSVCTVNIYGGNKRKDRPEGGMYVREEDTSKCLDAANGLNPTCSQGGTAVIQAATHCSDVAPTVTSSGPPYSRTGNERVEAEALAVTFQPGNLRRDAGADPSTTTTTTLKASAGDQMPHIATAMAVRRLTPVECERLQGFPDNWSRISWKGKPEEQCPDGPRYKACGNSMAVPVMRWIGERIAAVNSKL